MIAKHLIIWLSIYLINNVLIWLKYYIRYTLSLLLELTPEPHQELAESVFTTSVPPVRPITVFGGMLDQLLPLSLHQLHFQLLVGRELAFQPLIHHIIFYNLPVVPPREFFIPA